MEVIVSNARVDVAVSGQPEIGVRMETRVQEVGGEYERRIIALEEKVDEMERATIMPLYE